MPYLLVLYAVFLHSACVTPTVAPPQEAVTPPTTTKPAALIDAEDLHASHYVGIFQNDRLKKSFPAVMDLVVENGKDNLWQLKGMLRIYAPPEEENKNYRVISSYYDRIALHNRELSFAVEQQRIRVVKKASWEEEKITAFVVVYGFGQGQLQLTKQARTSFNLPQAPLARPL